MKFSSSVMALFSAAVVVGRADEASLPSSSDHHRHAHSRMLNVIANPLPVMTFFVPLQEQSLYDDVFMNLDRVNLQPNIETILSVAISTDKTVVWIDHWEDGFDVDVAVARARSTEVWGDGNAANGCPFPACTNSMDVLNAGTSVVIQNQIALPRNLGTIKYDGGDRIQSSFPVAVSRASFPTSPGSVMAGAVEVYDTTQWGLTHEAPVGTDTDLPDSDSFELSGFSCLAAEDNTKVTLQNNTVVTLRMGQSMFVSVKKSDRVVSNKPIQVVLLTADIGSHYETRWFTMRSIEKYESSYISPVGDAEGKTRVLLYNLGSSRLTAGVTYLNSNRQRTTQTFFLEPKQTQYTMVIPTSSGALIEGNQNFVALSVTDSDQNAKSAEQNDNTGGNRYDWGIPLIPTSQLTSQVLVGLGYACTNNKCDGRTGRNPVWLTPLEDADVYVDYGNTGTNQVKIEVNSLASRKIRDTDNDMSGATIFAVKRGAAKDGAPVNIAVAWGQDALVSDPDQSYSLDMGTTVPQFTLVKVAKIVDKAIVNPSEEMTYTIRISNVGHKDVLANALTVKDTLDPDVTYVLGSAKVSSAAGSTIMNAIPDSSSGTKFPFDDAGYALPILLPRRGGTADITFKVVVAASINTKNKIINRGTLTQVGGGVLPFEATSTVNFGAAISIANNVFLGQDSTGTKCGAVEYVEGFMNNDVTYCYVVTNTGKSHLSSIMVSTAELTFNQAIDGILAPGASRTIAVSRKILGALTNNAVVVASPVFSSGSPIPDVATVTATDPSRVGVLVATPRVGITNTVYLGTDNGAKCNTGVEKVTDIFGSPVVYCFTVVNNGETFLSAVTLKNPVLNFTKALPNLSPGQSILTSLPGSIRAELLNTAEVTGTPATNLGVSIGLADVKSSDTSSVGKLNFNPSIKVENTVYIGRDGGKHCGNATGAVEYVAGIFGTNVTYCFKVINTGETHLNGIKLVNTDLKYSDLTIGTLGPNGSVMRSLEGRIDVDLKNWATATGNPIMADGRDIPDLQDVTSTDPSEVDRKDSAPSVNVENTVLLGTDGKLCSTDAAKEFVQDFTGSSVTYCFVVKNNGNTFLDTIKLTNGALSFETTVPRLAPGIATTVSVTKTITGTFTNEVRVTANPTLGDGTDVPNAADVTDTDTSGIGEIAFKPTVKIANTVYLGQNVAFGCNAAVERVEGLFHTDVTYCFNVTNTGNTHLNNFRIVDDALSFQDQTTIKSLAPNAWALVTVPKKILAGAENTAKVTATPVKPDLSSLPLADVSSTDPSSVGLIAHKPSVVINNTVYVGLPGSCSKGVDTVQDLFLTDVVYCLRVTNTGDTHLSNVTIEDKELTFTQKIIRLLPPGESELISLPKKINSDLRNTAVVTANPVLREGIDIPSIPDVTHNDWSSVLKQVFTAAVKVDNTVYVGNDGGVSCARSVELVKDLFGTNVTFCFKVTNNGQTHLKNLALSNGVLSYTSNLPKSLAPGESVLVTFPSTISATRANNVTVTGTPITSDGREILDLGPVKASDPSGVELVSHSANVAIANTVYLGNDGGKSCATSVESVTNQFGSAVTYCFKVTNTGNSFLNSIVIGNPIVGYTNNVLDRLAPGASITVSVPGKITGSITNVANVTANPCLSDGSDIPTQGDVKATDPSSVVLVAHKSGVNIENTVYLGASDGGAKCATGVEQVKGFPQTAVMYCFAVKNVGESYLKDVVITNAELTFSDNTIKTLAPGETKIISLPKSITVDLNNTAVVTATPALADGTSIPNVEAVRDSDPSGVDLIEYVPKIVIENSVYIGKDGGKQCGTPAAREHQSGIYGTMVTYCFNVTNAGNTPLKDIVIVNTPLSYSNSTRPLAPGEWVVVPVDRTITVDLTNKAVVTATPTIPGLSQVKSEDTSGVDKFDFIPGVKIINKVYLGANDNGAKCGTDSAVEVVEGIYATAVMYCFTVVNTGDTHLADMVVSNDKLTFRRDGFSRLAPGQSITMSLPGQIIADLVNSAVVVANPVTESGQDIPDLANVRSDDPSEVKKVNVAASVQIMNTVYLGRDGGKKCGTAAAVEVAQGRFGSNVTYCFVVTNTGKSTLKSLVIENPLLQYSDSSIALLAPGMSETRFSDRFLSAKLSNVANVTGTPSLSDGTVIPGMNKVTSSDPSGVELIPFAPKIEIDNLVLLGSSPEKCDTAAAVNYVEHYVGALVTYCFEVTNKGDTHLNNITIVNPALSFKDTSIPKLAPQESVIVVFTSKISGSLSNIAYVTGNPILPDGRDIPDVPDVTWSDGSAVGKLEYYPAIKVDNKVYIGDDLGVSCGTKAVESVTGKSGTVVYYCFTVTNSGDTHLNGIKLVDAELNYTDSSIISLAPKASELVVFRSTIKGNLTNNVVATGNPSLPDGADISGAQDVTATDPSTVVIDKIDGTPKETPKDPYNTTQTCIQDKWTSKGKNGTLVCSSKQVYLESIASTTRLECKAGDIVTVTVDSRMVVEGSRKDLGWYVAADGGDALTGKCYVSGFHEMLNGTKYGFTSSEYIVTTNGTAPRPAGKVKWMTPDGGDDDECGDVILDASSGYIRTPVLVNAKLPCTDENEDGVLDVALCFTWNTDSGSQCKFSDNIPGTDCSCYCTRYDIKNVTVIPPVAECV